MGRSLQRLLAFYALAALLGTIPLLLDWALGGGAVSAKSLAGFSLLGGAAAGLARLLSIPARRWRLDAQFAVGMFTGFLTLQALYLINVALLPTHRALAPVSILWDLAAGGVATGGVWFALRIRGQVAPLLGSRFLPLVGSFLLAGALAQVVATWPVEPEVPQRRGDAPNLIVIVIDAARRDHLGLYGYDRPTSPSIDAWASRARVYDRALAASSWTIQAVPVILGSRPGEPSRHDVLDRLKSRGYVTACFSDNPLLEREGPLSKAFDHVGHSTHAAPRMLRTLFDETFVGEFVVLWPWLARQWEDSRLVDEALRWSRGMQGPLLLYVHLMDAHMPYRRRPINGRDWQHRRLETPRTGMSVLPEEAADIVAHYDGGLRSASDAAGRVLEAARAWARPYVAIVTADHGESLGEERRWGHGKTLAPELLDVPLLVVGQGVRPGRVEEPVGHTSVAVTLLRAAGVPDDGSSGSDLRSSDGDDLVAGSLASTWSYRAAHGYVAVTDAARGKTELFDLRTDPRREHDLSALHPELVRELAAGPAQGSPASLDRAMLEQLRALGYLDE